MTSNRPRLPQTLLALCALPALIASAEEGVAGDWLSAVQEQIAEQEYHVTWQDGTFLPDVDAAWHAPNRAHGFRTYFTEDGIRVVPRTEESPSWEWGLSLVGYGRGRLVSPVKDPSQRPAEGRIDYDRGLILEWYVNDSRGLEQGFTLFGPPEGTGTACLDVTAPSGPASARLDTDERHRAAFVELALEGTLDPAFSTDGRAIDFHTAGGVNVVHFAELLVTDAGGRELPAWMEGYSGNGRRGVRIVFDDTDAAYPVTIDPLATSSAWTAEGNQASAHFGYSVGTAGDVNRDGYADVIVGAYAFDNGQADEGRAFVFHGAPSGPAASAAWSAEGDQTLSFFGIEVGTAGDVNGDGYADIIVGARLHDNGQVDEGRAYVYHGSATGLSAVEDWIAESDQAGARFGNSVATAGDVNGDGYSDVIVGAYFHDNGQADEGRAYVYHGSAAGLSAVEDWTAESDQASGWYGYAVGTAGDVDGDGYSDVIVGAYGFDNGQTNEGRAYVYHGSAAGLSVVEDWTAEGDQDNALFGWTVGAAGDVDGDGYTDAIIGARQYTNGQTNEGRAFVYHGSAIGLANVAGWTAEGDQATSNFGNSVGTAGDVNGDGYADVIVGANKFDGGQTDAGRVSVYHGSATGLMSAAAWTAEGDQTSALFGTAARTAGDVNGDGYADVIVGANQYDNGQADEGRAFVYLGAAAGLSAVEDWTAEPDQASAQSGWSVGTAGDVNGDGYADVIVGAFRYDNGQTDEGRAYVYHGSAAGLSAVEDWSAESDQAAAYFGVSVSTAGDVNGDGYDDVVVGAWYHDNGQTDEGRAFLYLGSVAGLSAVEDWTAESDQDHAYFGRSVGTAGDVNGDGYADVIVGAYTYDNGELSEGRAFVYHGSAAGLNAVDDWTAEADQASAYFGRSVSTAGDVNGDGYADVVVGATNYDNGQVNEGRAYVYHGSATGLSLVPQWTAESDQASAKFGYSVSTAGDVNGDGYADVIVGAYDYDNGQTNEGRAYVYHGSAAGLNAVDTWRAEADQASAHYGISVSTAGDVNGDGYADVVVGVEQYDNIEVGEGRAYVYHGSAAGLTAVEDWTAEANQAGARFGIAVSTAGDVNGDGYADVIVGADTYDNGQADEGRAYVYYGNAGRGLSIRPQQRRDDDAAPIARGGHSRSPDGFRLAGLGRTPFGRGRVKLEWEVKERGQFLDGTNTGTSASWLDTGTVGVALNETVSGLEPGDYHWRVRLLYHPATSPFQQAGRWFTAPWGGQEETDLTLATFIGGVVWADTDGDGVRDPGEAGLARLPVQLLDSGSVVVGSTFTDNFGGYRFEVERSASYRVRHNLPTGYLFTLQDQGVDDTLDSDADPVTGETALVSPPFASLDATRWSAGMLQQGPCFSPDEPIYIYGMRLSTDGNDYPILDFQDPNQPSAVTGYNVYRSSNAGLPPTSWPQVASDVVDMDQSVPNYQWADTSGDVSPSGTWYYEVTPYNNACGAEGPR